MKDVKEEIIKHTIDHVADYQWEKKTDDKYDCYQTDICGQRLIIRFTDTLIKQSLKMYCSATSETREFYCSLTNKLFEKVDALFKERERKLAEDQAEAKRKADKEYFDSILKQLKHQDKVSKKMTNEDER